MNNLVNFDDRVIKKLQSILDASLKQLFAMGATKDQVSRVLRVALEKVSKSDEK